MTRLKATLLDALERGLSSAGQQFLVVVLAGGAFLNLAGLAWGPALSTAAGAFVLSILTSLITWQIVVKNRWVELGIRVVKTFAQSLLSTLGAGVLDVLHVHWVAALNVAATTAFLSLVKGLVVPNGQVWPSFLQPKTLEALRTPPTA